MAWILQDVIMPGHYIMASVIDGVILDFGSITETEVFVRVREYASGWTPTNVQRTPNFLGFSGAFRVFGRVDGAQIPADVIRGQVAAALNSFATIGGADVSVASSDSLSSPIPDDSGSFNTTLQLIALAAIVLGVVWGIKQIREISE